MLSERSNNHELLCDSVEHCIKKNESLQSLNAKLKVSNNILESKNKELQCKNELLEQELTTLKLKMKEVSLLTYILKLHLEVMEKRRRIFGF